MLKVFRTAVALCVGGQQKINENIKFGTVRGNFPMI